LSSTLTIEIGSFAIPLFPKVEYALAISNGETNEVPRAIEGTKSNLLFIPIRSANLPTCQSSTCPSIINLAVTRLSDFVIPCLKVTNPLVLLSSLRGLQPL